MFKNSKKIKSNFDYFVNVDWSTKLSWDISRVIESKTMNFMLEWLWLSFVQAVRIEKVPLLEIYGHKIAVKNSETISFIFLYLKKINKVLITVWIWVHSEYDP